MKQKKILFLMIAIMMSISSVSAFTTLPIFDYRMIKWNMCDSFNLTKYDCDFWWEDDSNPYYIKPTDNKSLTGYYNKTEVEILFEDFYNKNQTKVLLNSGELIDSKYMNSSEVDGKIDDLKRTFLSNLTGRFLEKETYEDDKHDDTKDSSGINDNVLIFGGLILFGGIGFLIYNNKKEQVKKKQTSNTSNDDKIMMEAMMRKKMEDEWRAKQPQPTPPQPAPQPQVAAPQPKPLPTFPPQ